MSKTSPAHSVQTDWSMKQSSDQYGLLATEVRSSALYMRTGEMKIMVSVPDPTLTIVSDETKRYLKRRLEGFQAFTQKQVNTEQQKYTLISATKGKICGFSAMKYMYQPSVLHYQLEFWCTEALHTKPELANACRLFVGCYRLKGTGLPLRLVAHNPNGTKFVFLDTMSIKPATEKVSWAVPSNYQKARSVYDLIAPDTSTDEPTATILDRTGKGSGTRSTVSQSKAGK